MAGNVEDVDALGTVSRGKAEDGSGCVATGVSAVAVCEEAREVARAKPSCCVPLAIPLCHAPLDA